MSTTSSIAHSAATSESHATGYSPARSGRPKKLSKSLVEFWAKPATTTTPTASSTAATPPPPLTVMATMTTDSSVAASTGNSTVTSSTTMNTNTSKKLRMVHGRYGSKKDLQHNNNNTSSSVDVMNRSVETATVISSPADEEVSSHRSPLGGRRLFSSHTTTSWSESSHDTTTRQKSSLGSHRPAVLDPPKSSGSSADQDHDEAALVADHTNNTSALTLTTHEARQQHQAHQDVVPESQQQQQPLSQRAFVFVSGDFKEDDDPFATPKHSSHHGGNISVTSPLYVVDHDGQSFDAQQQAHVSWVWDDETQEIHHHTTTTALDESAYSSTDGRIRDVLEATLNKNNDPVGSVGAEQRPSAECGSSQSHHDVLADTDMDLPGKAMLTDDETETTYGPKIPEEGETGEWQKMANVVDAANAAIQTGSDHFSDMSNTSFPSTIFHSTHQEKPTTVTMDDSSSRAKNRHDDDNTNKWTAIVQSPSQADLNRSEFSEGIMANIISAANAAIREKTDQSTEISTDAWSKPLEIGETPLRSNRQEDCSDAWKRQSPQKPVRSSPPSRRIMNASPQPPSPQASSLVMRRTLSKGDSKPSIRNDDTDVSFHDDEEDDDDDDESSLASSTIRGDTPGANFDRMFRALFDFVNPSDDQSSVDTMSTMSRRWQPSFDGASQDAGPASVNPRQAQPDPSNAFLDIRSWWTQETQSKKEVTTNQAADIPWLNKFQASMFEQRKSKTNDKAKEWERKSYLDATSFDALEEIATALRHKKNAKPAGSLQTAQDALSEQFLSLFERLRAGKETAEMNSSRSSDDGIEVTIDASGRPEVLPEETEDVSPVHTFAKEPVSMVSGVDKSIPMGPALSNPSFAFESISFDGHKNERRTNSLNVPSRKRYEPRRLSKTRTDFSLSEYIAKDETLSTPEHSMLIHNEERSLSPISASPESPLQVQAESVSSSKACDNDLAAQTSTGQASIEEQLRDLYAVVQHYRSAIHLAEISADARDSPNEETEDAIYRTPSPKKAKAGKHFGASERTPLTADETDTSPELGPKPSIKQSRIRRRAPKISITTLSGGETRNKSSPELGTALFACSLPDPTLPNDATFVQDPIWAMRTVSASPTRNSRRNLGTSYESDSSLTHLGHEEPFVPSEGPDDITKESTSPKRLNFLRKNRSSYSIMDDETMASINISNDRSHSSVGLGTSPAKETPLTSLLNVVTPLPSDVTRGSSSASLDNANQIDDSVLKRSSPPRGRKPLFVRQLSLSWLKRPNKQKASYWMKGSILDEESDYNNDTTLDSSLHSINIGKEMVPVRMPPKKLDIAGSVEEPLYGSLNGYSVESRESSREWTTPPKRTAVPRHTTATWRPSLQGLNDSWEEVAGPRVETISPAVEAPRFRSFQPQASLRTMQSHSTRPVRRADPKDNTNKTNLRSVSPPNPTPTPVRSSYLARTSSVPNMRGDGRGPLAKTTTPPQFQARPTGDISWAPPQQVMIKKQQRQQPPPMMMNTSTSSSEASYTVPPAADWEEFNGSGFWRAQEI